MSRRRNKRKRWPKAKAQRHHFLRRLAERFGSVPSQHEHDELLAQARDCSVTSEVFFQSLRVRHMLVSYCDNLVRVVYDRNTKELATALYDERDGIVPGWPGVSKRGGGMSKMRGDGTIPVTAHNKAVDGMAARNCELTRALRELADKAEQACGDPTPDAADKLLIAVDEARTVAEGMA